MPTRKLDRKAKRPALDHLTTHRANGARPSGSRATVVHVHFKDRAYGGPTGTRTVADRLAEAVGLAHAIDLAVVDSVAVSLDRPHPGTLLRDGKVAEIADRVAAKAADLVVVNGHLTPVQQQNLEKRWKTKVIDRTGLILEIFGARARTSEGALQVELAALTYQRSRLVRSWTHLERQRGGFGFLGGPGESQIEADRRHIDARLSAIRKQLKDVTRTRGLHRLERKKVPYPVVALVGYTNAGKSTLFNRLTAAGVFAENLLFATLDPTMRKVALPNGQSIILSDTVGFISDLPHELVAAFSATLEEVRQADFIVHVRDVAHSESAEQRADVVRVLAELGIEDDAEAPIIEVQNKIDLLDADGRTTIANQQPRRPNVVSLSARTGEGCEDLLTRITSVLARDHETLDVRVSIADGATLAWLYSHGEVVERRDDDDYAHVRVSLSPPDRARLARRETDGLRVFRTAADGAPFR
ncbi:MAG: GTPase HflX [Alphaproteobacteria bacterium]|nr:GTPase HflX [Alphaproteobacteria bacterium]